MLFAEYVRNNYELGLERRRSMGSAGTAEFIG